MDAIDSSDAVGTARQAYGSDDDGWSVPSGKARRRLRATGPASRLLVTSDLSADEPVTDAEIRLILAMLGDTLNQILGPSSTPCPASATTSNT
jgi:hypothetical protein